MDATWAVLNAFLAGCVATIATFMLVDEAPPFEPPLLRAALAVAIAGCVATLVLLVVSVVT